MDKQKKGRNFPPSSFLFPSEGHFWKSPVPMGPGQLLCVHLSLSTPQLSLCSQNSGGWGEGEEVVYLGWRWRRGIIAVLAGGGVPIPSGSFSHSLGYECLSPGDRF